MEGSYPNICCRKEFTVSSEGRLAFTAGAVSALSAGLAAGFDCAMARLASSRMVKRENLWYMIPFQNSGWFSSLPHLSFVNLRLSLVVRIQTMKVTLRLPSGPEHDGSTCFFSHKHRISPQLENGGRIQMPWQRSSARARLAAACIRCARSCRRPGEPDSDQSCGQPQSAQACATPRHNLPALDPAPRTEAECRCLSDRRATLQRAASRGWQRESSGA